MPGTFNGKTLTISATPTDGARIPDKNATNVAGIAIVGSDMYCVKTTGLKTTLYKTTNYTSSSANAIAVKQELNWFALGLTKIGDYLYMLAEDHKGYGGSTTIVKLDTAGNQINTFSITNICGNSGALGITAADGTNEKFIIMHYAKDGSANTLTFSVVNWGSATAEKRFTVTNSGYGYTTQLQDIYYHTSYGLFILTNNTFTTLQNRILVVDYKNTDSSGKNYVPSAVINVDVKGNYKQYNLESICMKANHLVLAANVITEAGTAEDRFSVLNGITYEKGTYSFNCALAKGMKVDNEKIGNFTATNFGALAFDEDNQKLYGIKVGSTQQGGYASPDVCVACIFELQNYTSNTNGIKDVLYNVEAGEELCLFHANGMDIYNHELYVTCAEPEKNGEYSVVKLTMGQVPEKWYHKRYIWENRTNAISHYKGNQFILLTETDAEGEEGKKIYKLCVVHFSEGKVVVDETRYFMNTGYEVLQGINYSDKYGLFIVTTKKLEYLLNNEVRTSGSRVLHIDMSRTKTMELKNGKKYPVLIPDFAFNNELDELKFFSFEMESVAIDSNTNNMIVSVNANSPIAGDNGKHPGEDYIYRFSSIEFK